MNKIQINDKYWITSDTRSWNISTFQGMVEDTKGKERESWIHFTHHPTFSHAVKSLGQRLLREASATSLSELKAEAAVIERMLKDASEQFSEGLE